MTPEGWKDGHFKDGIKLLSGQHIEARCVNNQGDGIPYLTGPADFPNGRLIISKHTTQPKVCCERSDILLTVKGSGTGKVIVADDAYCISRQLMAIRPTKFDAKFTYYVLLSSTKRYEDAAAGLIPGISRSDVLNTPIKIPPLPEQEKIGDIISTWDKAIETVEKLIDNCLQQKKALVQQLLSGKMRFPGFKDEWKKLHLGDVANISAGGTPSTKRPQYWGGDIPWMNSGEINFRQIHDVAGRITEEGLQNSSAKLVPQNSVLIALAGQGTTRGKVAINRIELTTNQSIAFICPDSTKLDTEFLFHNLDSRYLEIRKMSTGDGGRGGLNLAILKKIALTLPALEEQKLIARVLSDADKEINNNNQIKHALINEKNALMQQLLTGKRRVKVA